MGSDRKIRRGDHLWVRRHGYEHHGLAAGPHTVIHYSGKDLLARTGLIEEVPISTFAKDRVVQFIDHPDRLHNRNASVRRARERMGEDKYNLLYNNCEHFVMWCIEDKHTSAQVKNAVRKLGFANAGISMYRWYSMWATEKSAAGPTIRTAIQLLNAARVSPTVLNAAHAAYASTTVVPTIRATLGMTPSNVGATLAPIVRGLSVARLTTGVVGPAATAAGLISAPASVSIMAAALGLGLTAAAASALWDSIFD